MPATLVDYLTQLKNSPGTDAQIAAAIWTAVTRALTADPATDAGAATLVWTNPTRTITGVGVSMAFVTAINASVPSGSLADLRPAAGAFRYASWGVVGQSINWQTGHYNGTTQFFEQNVASSAQAMLNGTIGNSSFGFYAFNNGVSAGNYNFAGFDWTD